MKKIIFIAVMLLIVGGINKSFSQDDKTRVGITRTTTQTATTYFDYSDPNKVNIEVNIWGYVKMPGKYIIPKGTSSIDLISYAGGPNSDTKLDKVRLIRPKNDSLKNSEDKIYEFNFNDVLWEDKVSDKKLPSMTLEPGDIIVVSGEPKMFFRDNLSMILSISSTVISVAILLTTILKK